MAAVDDVDFQQIARCLWMEAAAGAAWTRLAEEGIPAILLKGPAIAHWLYRDDEIRVSRDVDILVPPHNFARAQEALVPLGYRTRLPSSAPACEIGPNSTLLLGANKVWIDLHHRLIGVADPPERCWEVLTAHTTPFVLATGTQVDVLDLPARTAHLALHLAQGGRADTKALADLERGLAQLPADTWRAAAEVACALGATPAFVAGLVLCPAGGEMVAQLALPVEPSLELELRTTGASQDSLFFVRLAEVPGLGAKAAVVARKLWPTRSFMTANYRLASHGRFGVVAARLWRPVLIVTRGVPAVLTWHRARTRLRRRGAPGASDRR